MAAGEQKTELEGSLWLRFVTGNEFEIRYGCNFPLSGSKKINESPDDTIWDLKEKAGDLSLPFFIA